MNFFRKNWIFLSIGVVSVLLAVLAILTATKLRQEKPIAPTAPESKPQALEGSPVPACQASFSIAAPSPTPTPSGTPSPTPTPTPGVTPTPTPTPTPTVGCNSSCSSASQCSSDLTCYITSGTSGFCRNAACQTESSCVCTVASTAPSVPVSGTTWPTVFLIIGGVALLVFGFAL